VKRLAKVPEAVSCLVHSGHQTQKSFSKCLALSSLFVAAFFGENPPEKTQSQKADSRETKKGSSFWSREQKKNDQTEISFFCAIVSRTRGGGLYARKIHQPKSTMVFAKKTPTLDPEKQNQKQNGAHTAVLWRRSISDMEPRTPIFCPFRGVGERARDDVERRAPRCGRVPRRMSGAFCVICGSLERDAASKKTNGPNRASSAQQKNRSIRVFATKNHLQASGFVCSPHQL